MEHKEFVVELRDGSRDWIDPVDDSDVSDDGQSIVVQAHGYEYKYPKSNVDKWTVRPYHEDTTYDPIEEPK